MNILYDTSALISLFIKEHPNNKESVLTHIQLESEDANFFMSAHSIAEIYSSITKGRGYLNWSPKQANSLLNRIIGTFFSVVELTTDDYVNVVSFLSEEKLTGGIIYDAIITRAAQKISADYIVTLDVHDFLAVSGLTSADFINPSA